VSDKPTRETTVLAEIWQDVLQVDQVDPDDDFYALGGDSLQAIRIVGAAKDRGLPLTLLQLFRSPTPRGAGAALAGALADRPPQGLGPFDLLAAGNLHLVPADVEAAYPATRLQLGMIYESLASEGALYVDTVSRTVNLPLDGPTLATALDRMAARHPVLRTRFDLATFGEPVQLVQRAVRLPLTVNATELAARHDQVMAALAEPYDPETAPLMRVHAAITSAESFRLSYSFHHAVIDGWSESIFLRELVTTYADLLRGGHTVLGTPAPFAEFVRLERAAQADEGSRQHFETALRGLPTRTRGSRGTLRKIADAVPTDDAAGLTCRGAEWGVPMKSLVLTACHAAAAAVWDEPEPVVGLAVSGRPELAGADLTMGLFLNHLPVRFEASGASWRSAALRALRAETELLPHRRFPYAEIRTLFGGDLFEVSLNYMRFHARDGLLDAGLIAADEDMRDPTDLPVRVEVFDDPRGSGLSLQVTADVTQYGEDLPTRLVRHLRTAIHRIVTEPDREASTA